MRAIQANLNEALGNERKDVPEHVPHSPFYVDFIDSDDANAMAFTEGDFSFIGITIALINRIWSISWPLANPPIATMLDLHLDTADRQGRFHVLLWSGHWRCHCERANGAGTSTRKFVVTN